MEEIKEEKNSSDSSNNINSDSSEESNERNENPQPKKIRIKKRNTIKADKTNTEIIFNKVSDIKKKRLSLSTSNRITSLLHMNSSKMVVRKQASIKLSTELTLSNIIDPSINFNMNYQLKETALKLFKTGFEEDQTKIKFFCNYLFQLKPFNKIFSKFSKSRDTNDQNKLGKILFNLALQLKYEYFEKSKIIYLHGGYPDKYYIILKGEVDIIIPNEMEVMMTQYEYYFYILRLYKHQEHSLLEKVLNKNYDIYPLDKKLLEDWIQTGFNTLINLEKESEMNKNKRKKKIHKTYAPNYTNTIELVNHLEKQKKLNLLMLNQNVILLLEKIRIRNEKARDEKKNKALKKKKKEKKKKVNNEENLKPNVGYVKLNGQMKKIFLNEDQIEVVEKCANEISQLVEMGNEQFNFQKFLNQLNRVEPEKYINRVKPQFFDEDTNEMLDPELFILSKSEKNQELNNENVDEEEDDTYSKLKTIFGPKKNVDNKKMELYSNRVKTIVYNYVLVNSKATGESFGEIIYESSKQEEIIPRISTIIAKENCHFASLKKDLYNKILKEFNENHLHQQFLFLYSLDLFKDCNKNSFMKNMSFFIKRTIRANEILFYQDDNLGDNRSLYFVESGSFISYCNISLNDIEILFNNLNYVGIIPQDDAHEDNLFNKENHYFSEYKKKKVFLNLFSFDRKDMIGYNDALLNEKYIYTVKCQSSQAIVYEIKQKFFNLIINSEAKLDQVLERYEVIKRNIMMKFFLNAFNNKINFYKFISFENLKEEREEQTIVHKNYFGKNPFRDDKNTRDKNNDRQNFKLTKTMNNVNNSIMGLIPELKNIDGFTNNTRLSNFNYSTKNNFFSKNLNLTSRQNSNINLTLLKSTKSLNKLIGSSKNLKPILTTEQINKVLKKKLLTVNIKDKYNKLKIETDSNNSKKNEKTLPIIENTLPKNNTSKNDSFNKNERFPTEYKEQDSKKPQNLFNTKTITKYNNKEINKQNEYSINSSILSESNLKMKTIKTRDKSFNGLKSFLDNEKIDKEMKNNEKMKKKEEIRLKSYLKDIPDFFEENKNSKKIFFGMNNKTLYQNNALFTYFK